MVLITHSGENAEKINVILKAAQKRFGLYGLEKTTMKEIASDLGMSKAALYYYFPDKEGLFKAVVEMEQGEFFQVVDNTRKEITSPDEMLREYIRIRFKYFKTLFNLSRLRFDEFKNMKPILNDTLNDFRAKEEDLVRELINTGNENGIFHVEDPNETAILFIEIIKGLRMQFLHKKELFYIEEEEYSILEKKYIGFTNLFIKGLKFNE
jgi:AcrR family transcriptional regulator